ncbi:MAG: hypothetical protein ACXABG_06455 [Promethearchaeota archaeon]|jgi:hypothetical membrane protein
MRNQTINLFINFIQERGAYFGVIGVFTTSISVIVALFLYTSADPTFNMVTFCVSDLGTGPNLSNMVHNLGAIITGFCLVSLNLALVKHFQNKKANSYLVQLTRVISVFSAIELILLGIIPFEREEQIFFIAHGSAAAIHYVAGSFAFIFYGFFELFLLRFSKILGIISINGLALQESSCGRYHTAYFYLKLDSRAKI